MSTSDIFVVCRMIKNHLFSILQVPCYSYGQKLSKLAILRIACNYILSLAQLAELDYSPDHNSLNFSQCVEQCTRTLQAEGRSKKRKVRLHAHRPIQPGFIMIFDHISVWGSGSKLWYTLNTHTLTYSPLHREHFLTNTVLTDYFFSNHFYFAILLLAVKLLSVEL